MEDCRRNRRRRPTHPALTKTRVDAARYGGQGRSPCFVWDGALRNFGLRVQPTGRKSFVLFYRTPNGTKRLLTVARYPEAIETAGALMEPHRITYYLMTLAAAFHTYYNRHRVLCADDPQLTRARLNLVTAVQTVIRNGLALLGVSAPDAM